MKIRLGEFPMLALLSVFVLFLIVDGNDHTAMAQETDDDSNKLLVSVATQKSEYLTDQSVVMTGSVVDYAGKPYDGIVLITVKYVDAEQNELVVHQEPQKVDKDGKFSSDVLFFEKAGRYTAEASIPANADVLPTSSEFTIKKFEQTKIFAIFVIGVAAFVSYCLVMGIRIAKHGKLSYTTRFFLITILAFVPAAVFVCTEFEVGERAPMGLVNAETEITNKDATISEKFQWIIHVGGDPRDDYASGIQIPLFVLIFGIAGGYIKYLTNKAEGETALVLRQLKDTRPDLDDDTKLKAELERMKVTKKDDEIKNKKESSTTEYENLVKIASLQDAMDDLVCLLLSPLLAIVAYFILLQAGIKDESQWPTIAVVSLGAGLLTDSIIERITEFGKEKLAKPKDKPK